jgi:hypothetical protein
MTKLQETVIKFCRRREGGRGGILKTIKKFTASYGN